MKFETKKLFVYVLMISIVASTIVMTPEINAKDWDAQQNALVFMTDVIGLDLSKYDTDLISNHVEYPSQWGGLAEERVRYSLTCGSLSTLDILFTFVNKTLYGVNVWVDEGEPILTDEPPQSVVSLAGNTLQRSQNFLTSSLTQRMHALLDEASDSSSVEIVSEDMKLVTSVDGNQTRFDWIESVNGIDFSRKFISFTFTDGLLDGFGNSWGLYSVGCSDVNVSREDAVEIARKQAGEYVLRIFQGGEYVAMNFSLREELVGVEFFDFVREPLVLYPFWKVQLYFDRLYGTADGIEVGIWADTGEVSFCQATGFSGVPDYESNSSSALTPQPSTSVHPSQTPAPVPSQTTPSFSASPSLSSQSPLTEPTATVTPEPKSSTSSTIEPSLSPSLQPQDENLPSVDVFTLGLLAVFAAGIVVTICFVHFMRKNSVSKKSL
ncbi:MAG: hypothetical protein ACBZ72_00540 [Candidatus Bathyarchaeia archaeon]|jgi:hypothetical protein